MSRFILKRNEMVTKEIITLAVCQVLDIEPEKLMMNSNEEGAKENNISYARQLCMALARKHDLGSQKEIGEYYGT